MKMKIIICLFFLQVFFVRFLSLFCFHTNHIRIDFYNILSFDKKIMGHRKDFLFVADIAQNVIVFLLYPSFYKITTKRIGLSI